MHPLDGPKLKLRRAEKHLDAVEKTIRDFIATNPYTLAVNTDPNPPNYVVIARVHRSIPNDELGLIIGDFAHNARSALDLLINQLSTLPLNDKRRFKLQFPIFDFPKDYLDHVQSYLAMVSQKNSTIIEGFQPYQRANRLNDDILGILRAINDTDKHRVIHVVGAIALYSGLGLGPGQIGGINIGNGASIVVGHGSSVNFGGGYSFSCVGDGTITKDGTVIAKITSPVPPSQMNIQSQGAIDVKFSEGNPRVNGRTVMDTLILIYNRVEEIIKSFESFFTSP